MKLYFESQHIVQIFRRLDQGQPFAIIGSMDGVNSGTSRLSDLEKIVSKLTIDKGVTYQYTTGRYTMKDGTIVDEPGYILYHITKEDALNCAKELNQESIIWNDGDFFGFLYTDGHKEPLQRRVFNFNSSDLRHYGTKINNKQGKNVSREKEYFPTSSEISDEKDTRKKPFAFSESLDLYYMGNRFLHIFEENTSNNRFSKSELRDMYYACLSRGENTKYAKLAFRLKKALDSDTIIRLNSNEKDLIEYAMFPEGGDIGNSAYMDFVKRLYR